MTRKKKTCYLIPVFLLLITILVTGCNQTAGGTQTTTTPEATTTTPTSITATQTSAQAIRDITVKEAYELVQQNKDNPDFIIVDIRTPDEYETGHLENAVLIDYYADNFRDELNKLDKNKTYLEYCRTARRSSQALEIFKELGFKDVLNMSGGINEWIAQGYPTVK